MKINNILGLGLCAGLLTLGAASCNKMLDLPPVNQITPEAYYKTADQLATYLTNYYNTYMVAPFSGSMFHAQAYNDGMARSDGNTDIMLVGATGSNQLFATDYWQVPTGKALQSDFAGIRVYNYFLSMALPAYEAGEISGDDKLIRNYIGEGYFFRALCYYKMLAHYGDLPIIDKVIRDDDAEIIENSPRAPRNEVARFILADLDKAANYLADRSLFNGQRVNKQAALLLKSRVALFEGTFEKYHKGSGRVPGDAQWPGAAMAYNAGKSFNADSEVDFFLTQAMEAAKQVADQANLTVNNHVSQPPVGTITGWNPYFEMYSQPSLANVPEVLLWKQYNFAISVSHDTPFRIKQGCNDGYTRAFTESFLMQDGLPIYASANYKGDQSLDNVIDGRDDRLRFFIWTESTLIDSDPAAPQSGQTFNFPNIFNENKEVAAITGYQPRKYYTYDYAQTPNDEVRGTNACPIFRTAEAMLNYMEASYVKNGSLDATARGYWQKLRERAGVSTNIDATIAATDLSREGDWGVYSGEGKVDATLYNIRRERMNETFSEGLRFADLIRWRAFDHLKVNKWIPEGVNFWEGLHIHYPADIKADGSSTALVSSPSLGKYIRPYSRSMDAANELRNGYTWHDAYYLYPLGVQDLTSASPDRTVENSNMYQNPFWPSQGGSMALQ